MSSKDKILLVDDYKANLVALKRLLKDVEADIHCANSGSEALECILKYDYALMLVDVQMPDMDGFELSSILKQNEDTSTIPIIFVTAGDSSIENIEKSYKAGGADYIQKPINKIILQSKIDIFLSLHRKSRELEEAKYELDKTNLNLQKTVLEQTVDLRAAVVAAETANDVKSMFLANMSHELRTPLNAIIGFSEIMKGQSFGPMGLDVYVDYAEDIYASGNHLFSIISDILDTTAMEAGSLALRESRFSIKEAIMFSIQVVKTRAQEHNINILLHLDDELSQFYGDSTRIRQVFVNLLTNSIKYSGKNTNIHIKSSIGSDGAGYISFQDSGIGMSKEELEIVFEPFKQLKRGVEFAHEGSGLGLSICKSIIELHNGSLEIESEAKKGTTVTMKLPADQVINTA